MSNRFQKLMFGASTTALVASGVLLNQAYAQPASSGAAAPETVTVTGTSIKGVAVIGSNVTQLGQKDITDIGVSNVTQALVDVPAIENFGSAGRGGTGSTNGQPGVAIYIHDVGAMGSGSTLVLIDGHRAVESGQTNYFVNPNVIPSNMLQRVDVLSDGASAVYGSDAIAGVVNFITRKQFEGVQGSVQQTLMDGSGGTKVNLLVGHGWDTGNFVFGVEFAHDQLLLNTARPWTDPLVQPARAALAGVSGPNGSNFGSFNCSPAAISNVTGFTGLIFLSPTATTTVANSPANAPCNAAWQVGAILPKESRESAMLKVSQEIFPRLTMDINLLLASRQNYAPASRGTVTATAFGTGTQANPFYVNPPVAATATSQQVRYDFNDLLGPGAHSVGNQDDMMGTVGLTYDVDGNWEIDFLTSVGRDVGETNTFGTVNGPAALLALNGTAQTGGSQTTLDLPGFNGTNVTQLPLTTANALDVWRTGSANLTSAAVKARLTDNEGIAFGIYSYVQQRISAQGTLFDLPAGPLKVSGGVEIFNTTENNQRTRAGTLAQATLNSTTGDYFFKRDDLSEYAEAIVPVFSPDMNIPLVQTFDIDLAVRHDHYSDVGGTINPKVGFSWAVYDDLKLRGNWSTSFVAPTQPLTGTSTNGATPGGNIGGSTGGGSILVSLYPLVTQLGIPGCTTASVSCNISTIQGISKLDGNANVGVSKGRSWSVGADFTPSWLPGFKADVTFWNTELLGGVVGPMFSQATSGPFASTFLILIPSCATPAQIANWALIPNKPGTTPLSVPQTSAFPACAQFLIKNEPGNFQYNYVDGIDMTVDYAFDSQHLFGSDFGHFDIGTGIMQILKFDDGFSLSTPTKDQIFSTINTNGFNVGFPTVAFTSRSHINWQFEDFSASVFMNWTGGYLNIGANSLNTFGTFPNGNVDITKGGDHVKANINFDLHLGYTFDGGMFGNDTIGFNVNNVLDTKPPFFNSSAGYDTAVANPEGRVFALSVTLKK